MQLLAQMLAILQKGRDSRPSIIVVPSEHCLHLKAQLVDYLLCYSCGHDFSFAPKRVLMLITLYGSDAASRLRMF